MNRARLRRPLRPAVAPRERPSRRRVRASKKRFAASSRSARRFYPRSRTISPARRCLLTRSREGARTEPPRRMTRGVGRHRTSSGRRANAVAAPPESRSQRAASLVPAVSPAARSAFPSLRGTGASAQPWIASSGASLPTSRRARSTPGRLHQRAHSSGPGPGIESCGVDPPDALEAFRRCGTASARREGARRDRRRSSRASRAAPARRVRRARRFPARRRRRERVRSSTRRDARRSRSAAAAGRDGAGRSPRRCQARAAERRPRAVARPNALPRVPAVDEGRGWRRAARRQFASSRACGGGRRRTAAGAMAVDDVAE